MLPTNLVIQTQHLLHSCRSKGIKIATAESCTGGLISGLLTEVPGSSDVFERGFVTYSNEAKHELLGVPNALLEKYGAVSEEVAIAMAAGALKHSHANIALSVTGIAGPGGGTSEKPVGLVYIGYATGKTSHCKQLLFQGDRSSIRLATVEHALQILADNC